MYQELYRTFLSSNDTLRIYRDGQCVFSSQKDRLLPLMEYLSVSPSGEPVVIFDKISGNAASLLAVKANCCEVYSPLGSELAINTLQKYKIVYHLTQTVPYIMRPDGKEMCPMEKLSIGKEPEEFYREIKSRIEVGK